MFSFKKKRKEENGSNVGDEDELSENADLTAPQQKQQPAASEISVAADLNRIKAEIEAFSDVRKATNERITRINEQIGEIRAMIADRDKLTNQIELKVTKAADLVEAVHPDQQMFEIKKEDAKIDALKANIESNEILMKRVLDELKDLRNQIAAFRGIEETMKMNQEVKQEIVNIKKVESNIERHADKVETIFSEVQKRFVELERIDDALKANERANQENMKSIDAVKVKADSAAQKKNVDELQSKFSQLKKEIADVIAVLNRKFTELERHNQKQIELFEQVLEKKFNFTRETIEEAVSALKSVNPADFVANPQNVQSQNPTNQVADGVADGTAYDIPKQASNESASVQQPEATEHMKSQENAKNAGNTGNKKEFARKGVAAKPVRKSGKLGKKRK